MFFSTSSGPHHLSVKNGRSWPKRVSSAESCNGAVVAVRRSSDDPSWRNSASRHDLDTDASAGFQTYFCTEVDLVGLKGRGYLGGGRGGSWAVRWRCSKGWWNCWRTRMCCLWWWMGFRVSCCPGKKRMGSGG